MTGTYGFLLDTYETEILKITGFWASFPATSMDYRPHPRASAGEFDGDEFGKEICTLYMYGPSAERLFDATIQILRNFHPPRASYAVKRFGKPGSKQERIDLASQR